MGFAHLWRSHTKLQLVIVVSFGLWLRVVSLTIIYTKSFFYRAMLELDVLYRYLSNVDERLSHFTYYLFAFVIDVLSLKSRFFYLYCKWGNTFGVFVILVLFVYPNKSYLQQEDSLKSGYFVRCNFNYCLNLSIYIRY